MPTKDREGAKDGGKVCSYNGPTLSSSTVTIPLVSRNGKEYEYLQQQFQLSHGQNLGLIKLLRIAFFNITQCSI